MLHPSLFALFDPAAQGEFIEFATTMLGAKAMKSMPEKIIKVTLGAIVHRRSAPPLPSSAAPAGTL